MSAGAPRYGTRHWPEALLVAVVVLVYLNAFGNAFVWDDVVLIENNPAIKSWGAVRATLTSDILPGGGQGDYYRPLQMLSYRLDHAIWRLDPLGYHLTSTLLHAAAALLFYRLALLLLAGSRPAALAAALLWSVHPAHTAAVTYLSGRADPLSAVFLLASLLAFARRREARFSGWRAASLAACFLALLARESALILPLLVVLLDRALDHREGTTTAAGCRERIFWRYLPYLAVVLLYWGLRLATVGPGSASGATSAVPLGLRLLTMLKTVVGYLAFLLVPLDPHMERRVVPAAGLLEPRVMGAILLAGLLVAIAWRHRRTPVGWGVAWFFIALLPVANLVPLATFMAEHWLYVPSMGLFLAAGWGLGLLAAAGWAQPAAALLVVAVAAWGGLTIQRNRDWHDAHSIFASTVKSAPWSARAWSNLGNAHLQAGELEPAAAALNRALALYGPGAREAVRAHHYLGVLERQRGRPDGAMEQFRMALAIDPGDALVHSEIALSLAAEGHDEEARRAFQAALALDPQAAVIHSNYGNHLFRRDELEEALAHYREALRLDPDFSEAYNNLGSAYFRLGKGELAVAAYSEALRLDPGLDEARRNLEVVRSALASASASKTRNP
jgi:tetratricopeptide (TPR) repeat protein